MKKIIPMCNENATALNDLLNGAPRTPPVPCRGPDCPRFEGWWCPYLIDSGDIEVVKAAQQIKTTQNKS
jgi:hypothetical protein